MKWISIAEKFPPADHNSYFIAGHNWIGIGIWEDKKGWIRGFITDSPFGFDEFESYEKDFDPFDVNHYLNRNVMWWAIIDEYPIYGKRMEEVIDRLKR